MLLQLELSGLEEQTPESVRSSAWVRSTQEMARPGWEVLEVRDAHQILYKKLKIAHYNFSID